MHIVVIILGLLGAAAFWWYRVKYMSEAARDVADVVGRVRGDVRRSRIRKKAAIAPVSAIDEPVTAAATVLMAIAAEDIVISSDLEERIRAEIAGIAESEKKLDEAMTYAKWATEQVGDIGVVIDQTANFLEPRLSGQEKEQLLVMLDRAAPRSQRHAMYAHRVERLRRKLGLEAR
jgi:hypothetical protein